VTHEREAAEMRPGRQAPHPTKRRISRFVTNRLVNPGVRRLIEAGLFPATHALLETTGRRSGQPRRVPLGNGLRDGVFWIVTEHGWGADYVKNIAADRRVRVKVGRRWYTGTARILEEEDPERRLKKLGRPVNDTLLRLVGSQKLVIRIDLDETQSGA
jgi:deazaflavin-dependent oxidoreductase (nitroreductase family)